MSRANGSQSYHKPILISYVSKEAEQHARRLKRELQALDFEVFLDVDEIEGGDDWVDALNEAVLNCKIFIALITRNYGYTRWTKREITLADMKNKLIIPISFLDNWPPECLAIQFASTHYIPWKRGTNINKSETRAESEVRVKIESESQAIDIRWDDISIKTVAQEIGEYLKKRGHSVTPESVRLDGYPFIARSSLGVIRGHPLIVISANPAEKTFVELIGQELAKSKYNIWSTTDMVIDRFYSSTNNRITPTVEGHTCNLSPEDFDRGQQFKSQVDASSLIIIVLSDKYCSSRTCRQQAFYCDTRKKVIPIKFNELERSEWFKVLFDDDQILEYTPKDKHLFFTKLIENVSERVKTQNSTNKTIPSITSNQSKPEEKL